MYMLYLLSIVDVIVTHPPMLQYETLVLKCISFGITIISSLKSIDCGNDSTLFESILVKLINTLSG